MYLSSRYSGSKISYRSQRETLYSSFMACPDCCIRVPYLMLEGRGALGRSPGCHSIAVIEWLRVSGIAHSEPKRNKAVG